MASAPRMLPRADAIALKAAVERLSSTARGSIWLVPEAVCKAYVLALYDGRNPAEAIRALWFGKRPPEDFEALADRSTREWLAGLRAVPVEIPRATA
jgi:hypothetical protein